MKKLALIWVILAAIFAIGATVLDIEPASTFITMSASPDGSFFIVIPVGLTFILCVLPLFPILIINNIIQNKKYKMPDDLTGMTGIIIKRETELTNAALMYNVLVNNEPKAKIGMGKKIFVELTPGEYNIQTKLSSKVYSPVHTIRLEPGQILAFQTKMDINKSLTTLVPKGEMLFLVQIPFTN